MLLGGDTPTVPDRRVLAVSNTYRYTITSDMYFACLDGPWNGEPDAAWAQNDDGAGGGDVDLAPEVFVGRAPVDTPDEADHFIDKTILYETTAPPNPTTGLSLGELLTNWPATWGGETNDYALSTAPADVEIIRLHEKLAPYGKQDVIDQLNASPNIVTHNGHSSFATSAKLLRSDVDALTNAHPYIAYSQGCNSGQFERSDAIAEHELKGPGGAVAGVWNTSLGWYSPGNPRGSGTKWAYDFWEAMFVENILRIGEAHFDAKMDRIALVSPNGGTGRWMHLTSTLFGDPELRLFLPLEGGSFVTGQSPSGITGPGVDRLRLEFAEPMDVSSFSLAEDLLSFEGPGGVDLSGQVTGFVWRDFFTLDILFQPQRAAGTYQLTIGPDVLDCSGRPMDQNRDGIAADGPSDGYQATFSFAASGSWATAYAEYLDFAPDWSLDPGVGDARWQWGRPTGQQGDPTSGYSGDNVVGYNLNGTYAPNTRPNTPPPRRSIAARSRASR